MSTITIIAGIITGTLAALCFIYVSFTAQQKGPILTNEYLFGTEQERKKIDKRASYHLLTGVFGCLGGMFTGAAIFIFTDKNGVCILIAITVGLASIIYAVIQSIRDKKSK